MAGTINRCGIHKVMTSCAIALAALALGQPSPAAAADPGPPDIVNPEVLRPRAPAGRLQTMLNVAPKLAAPPAEQRDIVYDLTVAYT